MSGPDDRSDNDIDRDAELGKLYTSARRALGRGKVKQAAVIVEQIVALAPDTTSSEELLGDVAMAEGRVVEARDHYLKAIEIEKANADAERKYGEAVLAIAQGEDLRKRVQEVADNPEGYRGFRRTPWMAAMYSLIPGAGQIYNREYEKGLALVAGGLILLSWILAQLVSYSSASLIVEAARPSGKLNIERAQQLVQAWGPWTWAGVVLAIIIYLGIVVYSILDAYRTCEQQADEADEVGVEL